MDYNSYKDARLGYTMISRTGPIQSFKGRCYQFHSKFWDNYDTIIFAPYTPTQYKTLGFVLIKTIPKSYPNISAELMNEHAYDLRSLADDKIKYKFDGFNSDIRLYNGYKGVSND